jgi:cytochrome c oxidase subunit 2
VEENSAFVAWIDQQPTYAQSTQVAKSAAGGDSPAAKGEGIAQSQGCMGCHSVDGSPRAGPTWKGLFGKSESLADGSSITVDETYLKESIVDPNAKVVKDFGAMMPPYNLSGEELDAVVAYIKELPK